MLSKYAPLDYNHKFCGIWRSMMNRCYNPSTTAYKNYGGRGILVCKHWHVFQAFYEDMFEGYRPSLEMDRKDNDIGYIKENCRWVTAAVNAQNRRSTKLTAEIAEQVRELGKNTWIRQKEIADQLGINAASVQKILAGRQWKK